MWDAITYVSSAITLVAFLGALVAWMYKATIDEVGRHKARKQIPLLT